MDIIDLSIYEKHEYEWLSEGRYLTTIVSCKEITANTGSKGVELVFKAVDGRRARGAYWLFGRDGGPSPVGWKLLALARHVGLSEEERKIVKPEDLVGRKVGVKVILQENGKYHAVDKTFPPDEITGDDDNDVDAPSDNAQEESSSIPDVPF